MSNQFDLFGDFKPIKAKSSMKLPLTLLLDTSGSMSAGGYWTKSSKIKELNDKVKTLLDYIKTDPKASQITDLTIITFGGNVQIVSNFDNIENIHFEPFKASGQTPLGYAVNLAIDLLTKQKEKYVKEKVEYYKPRVIIMSDGAATDSYGQAADRCSKLVNQDILKFYPIFIGSEDFAYILKSFSPKLDPKTVTNHEMFSELFRSLSSSTSNPDDDPLERWFKDDF